MNLNTALQSALSGLAAAGRSSSVVSENIANALTPGYARRTLELAARVDGSGVRSVGVQRHADPALIANRREADARLGYAENLSAFRSRLETAIGGAGSATSLNQMLAAFDNALLAAASRSDSAQRLDAAVEDARALADALNAASGTVQGMRSEADRKIATQVDRLNVALVEVEELNTRIVTTTAGGGETASLFDQRQRILDEINEIVPINIVQREFGKVALYTNGGAILLDGPAARIGFTPVNTIVPDMTIEGGTLSGLTLNDLPVRTARGNAALPGGTLAAQFEIRDELGTQAQADLDSIARDLIERYEDPAIDATRAAGDPGLFTDDGAAFDPLLELGLAGRLSINALVDRDAGGESWRLRDGLGAAAPGAPGEARLLRDLHAALETKRPPVSNRLGTGDVSAMEIGSIFLSRIAQDASRAEGALTFAAASRTELLQIELTQGVDTDEQMGNLMLIEQAYAANARVFGVIDELMETLLRI